MIGINEQFWNNVYEFLKETQKSPEEGCDWFNIEVSTEEAMLDRNLEIYSQCGTWVNSFELESNGEEVPYFSCRGIW